MKINYLTIVATFSPQINLFKFPGSFMLNTMIGKELSWHKAMAVASITFKPFTVRPGVGHPPPPPWEF